MPDLSLEDRVARLERVIDRLLSNGDAPKDWRRSVGMFRDDPIMKEVVEESRRLRHRNRND